MYAPPFLERIAKAWRSENFVKEYQQVLKEVTTCLAELACRPWLTAAASRPGAGNSFSMMRLQTRRQNDVILANTILMHLIQSLAETIDCGIRAYTPFPRRPDGRDVALIVTTDDHHDDEEEYY